MIQGSGDRPRTTTPIAATEERVLAAIEDGAWIAFSLSGGKDSSAAAAIGTELLDRMGHPRSRRIAIHADLGRGEWASTPRTVERIADHLGLPLTVVRHRTHDMTSRWEARFEHGLERYADLRTLNLVSPWSSSKLRFCTSEMKAAVITRELVRRFAGQQFISVVGIRRDESHERRSTPIVREEPRYTRRIGTSGITWHPCVEWSKEDVFDYHRARLLPLHEAYTRWGSTRLSCRFCVLGSSNDLSASSRAPDNHDAFRQLVGLESRSTFSFQPARWLSDVAPGLLDVHARAQIAVAKHRATERRSLEANLAPGLRYVAQWPPRMPDQAEAADIDQARQIIASHHGLRLRHLGASAVIDRFAELIRLRDERAARR